MKSKLVTASVNRTNYILFEIEVSKRKREQIQL